MIIEFKQTYRGIKAGTRVDLGYGVNLEYIKNGMAVEVTDDLEDKPKHPRKRRRRRSSPKNRNVNRADS